MKEILNKKNIIIGVVLIIIPIIIELLIFNDMKINIELGSILRLGYMYTIYVIIAIYKLFLNKFSDKLKKIFDFILKYRYIIGIITFIIMVIFKLNVSSIGAWNDFIPSEESKNTTLIGTSKPIRSDEWLVQTSFFLAQSMNKDDFYPLVNENIRPYDGQNMLMVYAAPIFDITIIGKPHNLGFILLGRDYGFSWYWAMKCILLILLSIEMAMILSKKDSFVSIVGGLWIAFSPGIMWWLSTTGDIYLHGFAIIVIFYYYIRNTDSKMWKKLLLGLAMISSIAGFVFCFYPPLQVPFAYLILAFLIVEYIKNRKKMMRIDYIIMGISLFLSIVLVGYYYYLSKDAINLMLNTMYPGKRNLTGGDLNIVYLINYFINFFTPFTNRNLNQIYNESGLSAFIYPLIGVLVVTITYFKNFKEKIKDKNNFLLIALLIVFIILFIWCFIGFGGWISKFTLFYMCQPKRVSLIIGLLGTMISILLITKRYNKERNINNTQSLIISTIVVFVSYVLVKTFNYDVYLTNTKILVLLPIIFSMTYFFILGNKKAFLYIIFIVTILTGMTINPIEYGTGAVYNTKTSKAIQEICSEDKSAMWIGRSNVDGQYLIANGAKTLNGVNYYPNFEWIKKLDSEGKYEEVYNRYAHISVELGYETDFKLIQADSYTVTMTYDDMKTLNIKYVLINESINSEKMENFKLQLVFSDDYESKYIYMVD